MTMTPEQILRVAPVVPVVVIDDAADAVPLAQALLAGGLPVIEITLRTPAALGAIQAIAQGVPGAIVGAGTVLTPAHFDDAGQAGARFAISPGASDALYAHAQSNRSALTYFPGVASASDVMRGMEAGFDCFKLFPAEAIGGVALLASLSGPFAEARFCPTGGIHAGNARNYLSMPNVLTVGGSWMVPKDAIQSRDWARIERLAAEAAALAKS